MLTGFIWVVGYAPPKARHEHDAFGVICSLLAALVALSQAALHCE
jgi:hypothetical protein